LDYRTVQRVLIRDDEFELGFQSPALEQGVLECGEIGRLEMPQVYCLTLKTE
jgi:hypothetical protein